MRIEGPIASSATSRASAGRGVHRDARAEGHPRDVGVHRVRALPSIDDRKARGRRHRHENPREGGRPRARGRAARPDRPGASTGRRAQRGGRAGRHRSGRRSTGGDRSNGSKRCVAAGAISRQEFEQGRTRCDWRKPSSWHSRRRCAKGGSSSATTASTAGQAGTVGDIAIREGDRVTNSTVITTIDDNSGLEAYIQVPLDRSPDLSSASPVQTARRVRQGRGDQPHHVRRAARRRRDADGPREERAQAARRRPCACSSSCARASSGARCRP